MVSIPSRILFLLFQCLHVVSELFATADHQGSSWPKLRVYPRVEIVSQTQDCSAKLAHESKLLHRVLPLKRRLFSVADDQDYATPRWLNPDFTRLTGNKMIAKSRAGAVSYAYVGKVEKCSYSFLEGNSHSSALLSQLKQDGFISSDPTLFGKTISSLSCTLAFLAVRLCDFVVLVAQVILCSCFASAFCSAEA